MVRSLLEELGQTGLPLSLQCLEIATVLAKIPLKIGDRPFLVPQAFLQLGSSWRQGIDFNLN